jgi:uncharacterized protein (TIGR03067 family)
MCALLILPLLMLAVPDRRDPTPSETKPLAEQLQGKWQPVKRVVFGDEQRESIEESTFTIIDATRGTDMEQGKPARGGFSYTIDITKKPAAIDLGTDAKHLKVTGIFKIEGDTLTMCLSFNTDSRPTQFISTRESQTILIEMRRYNK